MFSVLPVWINLEATSYIYSYTSFVEILMGAGRNVCTYYDTKHYHTKQSCIHVYFTQTWYCRYAGHFKRMTIAMTLSVGVFLFEWQANGPFYYGFSTHNSHSKALSFCCDSFPACQITTNFCTCHDSMGVVACAKVCSDNFSKCIWKQSRNFHRIWIAMSKCPWNGFLVSYVLRY